MVTASTVNAYTGASSYTFYITKPQAMWEFDGEPLEDISGWRVQNSTRRRTFSIETYPFDYGDTVSGMGDPASGVQDIDNVDEIANLIAGKDYLWLTITGGSRLWPSTAGQVHPIVVMGWAEAINATSGTRTLTIDCALRGRS
jgi:hypothetical protein